ncbi:10194_t:CDS:1, partial [Racocetra persica]
EIDKGISPQNVFIIGLSQGGSLALAIAMSSKYELGGFISLAGFIPYPKVLKAIERGNNKTVPIFMGHGSEDKIVPYEVAQKSFQTL